MAVRSAISYFGLNRVDVAGKGGNFLHNVPLARSGSVVVVGEFKLADSGQHFESISIGMLKSWIQF
tara:strand:+ start:584 stop:781 length:198 start_codon:yes stop_codon:yes gene_type:complete